MGELHDRAVEEVYKTFDWLIHEYDREVFWDEVYTEQDYFEGQIDPREVPEYGDRGKQVGEIDVLLVGEVEDGESVMKYFEVKPRRCDLGYAEEQVDRCRDFFGPRGWQVLTEVYPVPEWSDNWYAQDRDFDLDSALRSFDQGCKYSAGIDGDEVPSFIEEKGLRDEDF